MNDAQLMDYAANQMRRAADVNARIARASIRLAGMVAANATRESHGYALAYDEGAFLAVIDEEGIDYNAVTDMLTV